jgi:hypothetical protein
MIDARKWIWIPLGCLLLGLVLGVSWPGCKCDWTPVVKPPVVVEPPKPKPDRVVYVFEKDDSAPSIEVMTMLDKLNRAGIEATDVDDDVVDGDGQVPDQYKAAIDAARLAGLPTFVLLAKGEFLDYADLADLQKLLEDAK